MKAWIGLLFLGVACSHSRPVAPLFPPATPRAPTVDAASASRCFDWYAPLAPPTADATYVVVEHVRTPSSEGVRTTHGMLVEATDANFTVVWGSRRATYERPRTVEVIADSSPDVPGFVARPVPIDAAIGSLVASPDCGLTSRVDLFYLAYEAHLARADDIARRALARVRECQEGELIDIVREDVAADALVVALGHWTERTQLYEFEGRPPADVPAFRRELEVIVARFPESAAARSAASSIAELAVERPVPTTPLARRIETILADPAWCVSTNAFSDWPSRDGWGRIESIGFTALPALLPYVESKRPTQCLAPPEEGARDVPLLVSEGDAVLQMFTRMAGAPIATRAAAEAFIARITASGELEPYNGGGDAAEVAFHTGAIQRDPASALPAAFEAARTSLGAAHLGYVRMFGQVRRPEAIELLRAEEANAPNEELRSAARFALEQIETRPRTRRR